MLISAKFARQLIIFTALAIALHDVKAMQTTKDPVSLKEQCAFFIAKKYDQFKELINQDAVPDEIKECLLVGRINTIDPHPENRTKQVSQIAYDILHCGKKITLESKIIEFLCTNYFEFKKKEKKQFSELIDSEFIKKNGTEFRKQLNIFYYPTARSLIISNWPIVIYKGIGNRFPDCTRDNIESKDGLLKIEKDNIVGYYHILFENTHLTQFPDCNISGFNFIANESAICIKKENDDVFVLQIPWQTIKNTLTSEQLLFLYELYDVWLPSIGVADVERLKHNVPSLLDSLGPAEQSSVKNVLEKIQWS